MKRSQTGFTLIELVVVIVILGILAATALPKFIDLRTDAETAAVAGVAGALGSGTSVNYAQWLVSSGKAVAVSTCATALGTMVGSDVAGYTITAVDNCTTGTSPKTGSCTVQRTGGTASISAVAGIICTN